jgi:hypothetical protein
MNGLMAKTLHPTCALVAYSAVTAIVFAGLLNSPFNMFAAIGMPTCMDGTTSTPYPYTLSVSGVPTPPSGPNAPNADSVPFCTSEALFSSYNVGYVTLGYLGSSVVTSDLFLGISSAQSTLFCFKASNGTCDSLGDLGVNTFSVSISQIRDGTFQITDARNFLAATAQPARSSTSASNYNNFPITFGPSGANLPIPQFDISKTYYIRNYGGGAFQIAQDTTSPPIAKFTSAQAGTFTVTMPTLATCATQNNMAVGNGPSNINLDGTLKQGSCGYCLTKDQSAGVLAVPGLCGITIALLLMIELMMCIPAVRKLAFFRILVIVVSLLCTVFLIAAVSSAASWFYKIASCNLQTDFTLTQFMPSPTRPAFSGYTPSSGGTSFSSSAGQGLYRFEQFQNRAAFVKPTIVPGAGAITLIIAVVLLFFVTIFFAIKTDWTAISSGADSSTAAMMTPR